MKSFLFILIAVAGLISIGQQERESVSPEAVGTPKPAVTATTAKVIPNPQKLIPSLQDRHAARDQHLRKRLVEAHAPNCRCGRH